MDAKFDYKHEMTQFEKDLHKKYKIPIMTFKGVNVSEFGEFKFDLESTRKGGLYMKWTPGIIKVRLLQPKKGEPPYVKCGNHKMVQIEGKWTGIPSLTEIKKVVPTAGEMDDLFKTNGDPVIKFVSQLNGDASDEASKAKEKFRLLKIQYYFNMGLEDGSVKVWKTSKKMYNILKEYMKKYPHMFNVKDGIWFNMVVTGEGLERSYTLVPIEDSVSEFKFAEGQVPHNLIDVVASEYRTYEEVGRILSKLYPTLPEIPGIVPF